MLLWKTPWPFSWLFASITFRSNQSMAVINDPASYATLVGGGTGGTLIALL
jgi:hypothetical protein